MADLVKIPGIFLGFPAILGHWGRGVLPTGSARGLPGVCLQIAMFPGCSDLNAEVRERFCNNVDVCMYVLEI